MAESVQDQWPRIVFYCADTYVNTYDMKFHTHTNTEIFYCKTGMFTFSYTEKSGETVNTTLAAGEFAVISGNVPHKMAMPAATSSTCLVIEYILQPVTNKSRYSLKQLYADRACMRDVMCAEVTKLFDNGNILNLILMLQTELERVGMDAASDLYLNALLVSLLYNVADCYEETLPKNPVYKYVRDAVKIINSEYRNEIDLEELCQRVGISQIYLRKLFNAALGMSTAKYINDLRIRKAQELLRSTGWTVKRIAEQTGFKTTQNFAKLFKKHTGVTPMYYKKYTDTNRWARTKATD